MRFAFNLAVLIVAAATQSTPVVPANPSVAVDSSSTTAGASTLPPTASGAGTTTTTPVRPAGQCVVGLEKANTTYSCGAICNSVTAGTAGSCSGGNQWSAADVSGTCGASIKSPCNIAVVKSEDSSAATCGKCYSMTKTVGKTTKTIFAKVISVDDVKGAGAKFQLPTAVFQTACPVLCAKGGCALTADDCKEGSGTFPDCIVATSGADKVESFNVQMVDCDSGSASGVSSLFSLPLAAAALLLTSGY